MATSPDSIPLQADIAYGVLGPYPANSVNVQDFGLDPTGNDDCAVQAQAASDALPASGGELVFPAGEYLFSRGFYVRSNVRVRGAGRGVTRFVAQTNFPGATPNTSPAYSFIYNENWSAADLASGDNDISIEGITFDYSWLTVTNAFASLKFRYITRLSIRDCRFYYGGNAIAVRGCEQTWVENNTAYEFRNCPWDFWEGPGTTFVRNNYAETSDTAQMLNFNPEVSPIATSPLNVAGKRLTVEGNVFKATGTNIEPIQIEPLANRDNSIDDVVFSGNLLLRTFLACRRQTTGLAITNNVFDDIPAGAGSIIIVGPVADSPGRVPSGVVIANNTIKNPTTPSTSYGVIRCEADSGVVIGNIITGTSYTAFPFYSGTAKPNSVGNYYEKLGTTGQLRQGFILSNPNDVSYNLRSCIGWEDTSGATLRMYMAGDFHQFWTTDGSGNPRQLWSMQAHNSASQWSILLPTVFGSLLRLSAATGLTAAGTTSGTALQLTLNNNTVATTAAGTGVRLPEPGGASVTGAEITIWNDGANTLNVYPMAGGQIDALGVNIPDTIAAGANKTYTGSSATLYRIKT